MIASDALNSGYGLVLVRILATISDVNSLLDKCAARLSELRAEARQIKA